MGLTGVVFDDQHFADDASLEVLQSLATGTQLRWIVATRAAEVTVAGQAFLEAFEAAAPVERITLAPLTVAQIAELIASLQLPGLDAQAVAPGLAHHTGGNPLFMLEALKAELQRRMQPGAGGWPVAGTVASRIERRIGLLSMSAVQLARSAAVAAPDFGIELASTCWGCAPSTWPTRGQNSRRLRCFATGPSRTT